MNQQGLTPAGAWAQFKDVFLPDGFFARLLGIRGYFHPEGNLNGVYDDLITLCVGPEICFNYRASTDPGKFYIENPLKHTGCARLVSQLAWYSIGLHQGKHMALVQASALDVERLDAKENIRTIEKQQWIGANIHSGGPSEEVGKWSAGCQVIHSPEGAWGATWLDFFNRVVDSMKLHLQTKIPYLLTDKPLNVSPL